MMGYLSGLFHLLVAATLWHCIMGNNALFPQNTTKSLALGTDVMSSSTCQSAGSTYNCNYCDTRTSQPASENILKTLNSDTTGCSSSVGADTPVSVKNGALLVDRNNTGCQFEKTVSHVSDKGYALSFWIWYSCDDCLLFTVTSGSLAFSLKIHSSGNSISLLLVDDSTITDNLAVNLKKSNWNHIGMIFFETSYYLYVNGQRHNSHDSRLLPTFSVDGTISFGNFSGSFTPVSSDLKILDLRFYCEALTEREIEYLFNSSSFPDLSTPPWDCRCPPTHPVITTQNQLICTTTEDSSTDLVPRLLTEAHLPIFAIDNNQASSWVTDKTEKAWIFLTMDRIYQVDGITIEVNNTVPLYVIIQFGSSLGSQEPISSSPSGNIFTWSAGRIDEIKNRQDLMRRLASSINITLSGHADSSDVFSVVEIHVNRRENCFGNSDQMTGDRCFCPPNTKTTGQDCGTCLEGYYHGPNDFDCSLLCNCTIAPGIKTPGQCNQDGGACLCKANVEDYFCDSCKHLTSNLTASNPDGCTPCTSCDPTGSKRCDDNEVCFCKSNVIGPKCDSCSPKHYGLLDPEFDGCQPCACDTKGTDPDSLKTEECDIVSGNCSCKEFVTGRKCDQCKGGYKNLDFSNSRGCTDCRCNKVGSQNITSCDSSSGQCLCLYDVTGNLECNPMFDSETLNPAFGPIAGGTEVTIKGNFFKHNSDSTEVKILISGENVFLPIKRLEEKMLVFTTNNKSDPGQFIITVQWPRSVGFGGKDFSKEFPFTFKANPVVTEPMNATVFKSGGCDVKIKGRNFGSVNEARLIAHTGNTEVLGRSCINIGESLINCPSPDLSNYTGAMTISYGLQLDGITMYRDLKSYPAARITVVDNPTVDTNNDLTIDNIFSTHLVIKGSDFDKACEGNFEIKLGNDVCPIESMTSNEVKCSPVIVFPGDTKEVELKVLVGSFQSLVGIVKIKSFWVTWQFIIIAASVGGCILLIVLIAIVVKCCHRCRAYKSKDKMTSASTPRVNQFDSIESPIIAEKTTNPPRRNNYTDMSEMPLSDVESEESIVEKFLHKLDSALRDEVNSSLSKRSIIKLGLRCTQKGAEIRLIDGQFQEGPFTGQDATIKTLVAEFKDFGENLLPRWIGTGLAETLRFRDCFQENLHRSCGITLDQSRFYVLYPATKRILKEHLRDRNQEFTSFSLIEICQRIAEAMDYLSSNDIVHRDLATRNCVVCSGEVVKISDAAFSWSLFPDEYMYDSDRERWLPVRWMAQDSLQSGFYSTTTDVWSYGVLMWEVMSRGVLLPYFDIENDNDIKDHVINGYRLGKPDTVPNEMYRLMMSCWDTNHSQRPAFVRIIEQLIDILNPQEPSNVMYQNQPGEELPEYGNIMNEPPKLPSRANMPANNGNVNFGFR